MPTKEDTASVQSSGKKARRLSLLRMFSRGNHQRSRSPSEASDTTSMSMGGGTGDSSEDDRSVDLGSYAAAAAPLCFKTLATPVKKIGDLNDKLHMFDDDDHDKYLRKPKYIKTFKKHGATIPIAQHLFLAQELRQGEAVVHANADGLGLAEMELSDDVAVDHKQNAGSGTAVEGTEDKNAIWTMKFSLDGKFLASAGKSRDVKIWKVIASPLDRIENSQEEGDKTEYASVFQKQPFRDYTGHTDDILSLDWSKNNFLLTSSMDKTVKLWNVNQDKCLRTHTHPDFVPSVKFHPTDDRFFVSGCLDHKVRLWSILESKVSYVFDAEDLVTAVTFTPNGSLTIAGTFKGIVYFLDTQNLELRHSLDLNRKHHSGTMKITGIESYADGDDIKVLISSNDSRCRLISLRNKQLECYFKGMENESSQIIATVSDDHRYIITGSENNWVYLWDARKPPDTTLKNLMIDKKKRTDYTSFHAHNSVVTCALVAPHGTFKALSLSNDYIFELNHELSQKEEHNETLLEENFIGGIIVSADNKGVIRVFRQDFSSSVRKLLIAEKKNRTKEESRMFANKHATLSNASLLSRNNSLRASQDTPTQGRSRSGTVDSTSGRRIQSVLCDVCSGDKFRVAKSTQGLEVFCTDCGNQIT